MSNKIAIVTDSTASLTEELLKEHNIFSSYLMIIFGQDSYQEFKEISPAKFLELCATQDELPSTSQPAIGLTVDLYERIFAEGYDEIIHVTISGEVSGSFASATSAAEMVGAEKIHIFDSKTMVFGQGGLAIEASKLAKSGKSVPEILTALEKMRQDTALIAAVKNLENLRKGGRLSNAGAVIGGVLQIKPIVHLTQTGTIEALGKVRTFKKAIQFLVDQAREANLDESQYEFCVLHMENPEECAILKSMIREIYPNINIHETPLSLVVSAHIGPGAVAVSWYKRAE
ncbi:MAG: DegV family protein [Turicibacter sp.]|nr:DegV family protein [Turicibacter sp.]